MVVESGGSQSSQPEPIFILGILPRCGTNYLADLLCLHPDCGRTDPVYEDFIVCHADVLLRYAEAVRGRWNPAWGNMDEAGLRLCSGLGTGLSSFLRGFCPGLRPVAKTPRVDNIGLFFRLFPAAHLVVLVRDGRAVVESGVRTFGWNRDFAIWKWVEAADRIAAFERRHGGSGRYHVVRYEGLCSDLEGQLTALLGFLGLDPGSYDFAAAGELGVRGSSDLKDRGGVHWEPVARGEDFDPLKRFAHWSRWEHESFNHVAGPQLERLGYVPQRADSARFWWRVRNLFFSWRWRVVRVLGEARMGLRRGPGRGVPAGGG